ncbi:hypothetical protein TNCV_275501 [Trichonephila clavipes]|nr:hypothetical protein TNCV_275501 [Trichonephila clavipes]
MKLLMETVLSVHNDIYQQDNAPYHKSRIIMNSSKNHPVVGRSLPQINLGVQGGIHGGSHKQSPDNAHSVAFSQRSSSPCLIEDETFNANDMNNLIDYKDGHTRRPEFFENG